MDQMKDYKQLIKELPSKTVVFAFGRFNPPTIGHELLVKAVKKLAQQKNADHVIYASRSQDSKKNPLTVDKKVKYLNLMFRNTHFAAANEHVRTFIEAAKELNKRYKNIVMVAGSDRVPEFKRLLNTYNGKDFNFDTIEVISAGERDPDADDASGMSASKMRAVAVKGNYAEFKRGLPSTVRDIDGKRLMNDIREGMGLEVIKEQIVLVKDDLREKYFRGEIYNEGDLVESAGETYTIVKRGSNHLLLKESSGKLVSKWIHDVQPKEEENMNEELTQKTLKTNDKIKVARVIATMLGIDNAETSSNPDNLVNLGLRKVRSKALNPEAIAVVKRMLELADSVGIKYDSSLLPTKLKEAVVQPNGTDKVEPQGTSPVVKTKEVMRFNDYKKGKVGNTLHNDDNIGPDNQTRKMKVKYKLGEEEDKEKKEMEKANLDAKHAREKESLSAKHDREKENIKENFKDLKSAMKYASDKVKTHRDPDDGIEIYKHKSGSYDVNHTMNASGRNSLNKLGAKHLGTVRRDNSFNIKHNVKEEVELEEKKVPEPTGDLKDACWKGYTAVGMKMKNGKKVPNCVPVKEELEEDICPECNESPCVCDDKIDQTKLNPTFDPFFKESAVDVEDYEEKWEEHIFADEEPSEEELDHFMHHISDDDIYDLYDEDELALVDDETGEELPEDEEEKELEEGALMEVLSRIERMKAKFRIRRTKAKRERATKIALKRYSNTKTINKRSRRLAIKMLKKRLLRGRDISKLSVGEKERVEKVVQSRKKLVDRLAMRLSPKVRKVEKARLSHGKVTKGSTNVAF